MKLKELIDKVSITELKRYINTFADSSSSNNHFHFYQNRKSYFEVFDNLKNRLVFPIDEKEKMIIYCFNTKNFPEMLLHTDDDHYDMVKCYRKIDIDMLDDEKDTPWNCNPPIFSYNCGYATWNDWLNYEINDKIDVKQFP